MDVAEHPYVKLAREAISHYSQTGRVLRPEAVADDPPPCGVFVSLHEAPQDGGGEGPLRGCIGSTHPREASLRTEIARSAVSAAFSDPRFRPLSPGEIERLHITVYLLGEPELIADTAGLDPARYGVLIEGAGRRGLLLPAIPGITTVERQLDIAMSKAGLSTQDRVDIYRFEATILN